ncbi:MAG TPA: hypothetical protein VF888_08525 [Nitrospirota bacterium]
MKERVVLFQTHAMEGSELIVVSFGIVVEACRGVSSPERHSRWKKRM